MAFISDNVNFRTYDPEGGYELFLTGGGSDGTHRFRLTGPQGEQNFSAHYFEENLRPEEVKRLGPDFHEKPIVWCVHNWSDDWKSIIREAMTAFVINYGSPIPGLKAFVRFGTKESIFDV